MKTAEEFLESSKNINYYSLRPPKPLTDDIMPLIEADLIEFAKMHVEEALKQAIEKCEINYVIHGHDLIWTVKKYSILDSYPLENIK